MNRIWLKRICQTAAAFTAVIIIFTAVVAPVLPAAAAGEETADTAPDWIRSGDDPAFEEMPPADEGYGEPEEPAQPEPPAFGEMTENDAGSKAEDAIAPEDGAEEEPASEEPASEEPASEPGNVPATSDAGIAVAVIVMTAAAAVVLKNRKH